MLRNSNLTSKGLLTNHRLYSLPHATLVDETRSTRAHISLEYQLGWGISSSSFQESFRDRSTFGEELLLVTFETCISHVTVALLVKDCDGLKTQPTHKSCVSSQIHKTPRLVSIKPLYLGKEFCCTFFQSLCEDIN